MRFLGVSLTITFSQLSLTSSEEIEQQQPKRKKKKIHKFDESRKLLIGTKVKTVYDEMPEIVDFCVEIPLLDGRCKWVEDSQVQSKTTEIKWPWSSPKAKNSEKRDLLEQTTDRSTGTTDGKAREAANWSTSKGSNLCT